MFSCHDLHDLGLNVGKARLEVERPRYCRKEFPSHLSRNNHAMGNSTELRGYNHKGLATTTFTKFQWVEDFVKTSIEKMMSTRTLSNVE